MKKPLRFRSAVVSHPREWTKWNQPVMKGYHMACCDCGLVHEMDFRVIMLTGKTRGAPVRSSDFIVQFRVRQDSKNTKHLRKSKAAHPKETNQ